MQQDAADVKATISAALDLLEARAAAGHTTRHLADAIGTDSSTVSRWMARSRQPTGETLRLLLAWAQREGTPRDAGRDYWRGVLYACEAMTETTHRLLREAREADAVALDAKAKALIPPVPTGAGPAAAKTPPPRRRRASG